VRPRLPKTPTEATAPQPASARLAARAHLVAGHQYVHIEPLLRRQHHPAVIHRQPPALGGLGVEPEQPPIRQHGAQSDDLSDQDDDGPPDAVRIRGLGLWFLGWRGGGGFKGEREQRLVSHNQPTRPDQPDQASSPRTRCCAPDPA